MRIELRAGEILEIVLADTDGLFVVDFDSNNDSKLTISADMADTSGRVGIIYEEDFSATFMEKCFPEKIAIYDSLRDGPEIPAYEFASWAEGPIACGSTSLDPEPTFDSTADSIAIAAEQEELLRKKDGYKNNL